MDEIVTDGKVWIIRLPIATYGQAARVALTLLKLRFFNLLQSRATRPALNNGRYVFFACDEYQQIVTASHDGPSDLTFWDTSRSTKCIGIVSAQSVSSFRAAVGDKTLADTIIQNFRQKFIFRTEDAETVDFACNLLGKIDRRRISYTEGPMQKSSTTAMHLESVLNPQFFRGLNGCLALLQIDGGSVDDVLVPRPLYL